MFKPDKKWRDVLPSNSYFHLPVSATGPVGPPRWPSGKASASRAAGPGFESRLRRDFFRGRVIPET